MQVLPAPPPLLTLLLLTLLVGLIIGHLLARHNQLAGLVDAEDEARDLRKQVTELGSIVDSANAVITDQRKASQAVIMEQRQTIETLTTSHLRKASDALLTIVSRYEQAERQRTIEPAKTRALPAAVRSRRSSDHATEEATAG